MKVVETQDLASLRGTHQLVSLDFHITYMADYSATTKHESPHDYSYLKRLSYKNR